MKGIKGLAMAVVLVWSLLPSQAQARGAKVDVAAYIQQNWVAYFDIKGKLILVESMMPNITEDYTKQEDYWYYIKYSDYKGPKQRLAVIEFENKVPEEFHAFVPLADLESQLVSAIFQTNRYVLLERKKVDSVVAEQDFGASGRVAKPSAAPIGQILGAQFLVQAAITQYIPDAASFGAGGGAIGAHGAGGIAFNRKRMELAMNVRIIDATTSEIIASVQKTGWSAAWGLGGGGVGASSSSVGGGGAAGTKKVNVGKAAESCMAKVVFEIARALKDKPWQGAVMSAKESKIYVNAGENLGMTPGMNLRVLSKGEALVDPDTGLTLGAETKEIGSCTVVEVKDKYSIAAVKTGCEGAKQGDILEFIN
jgi:curli biogenesis system outer membrane secretion channel CsgG